MNRDMKWMEDSCVVSLLKRGLKGDEIINKKKKRKVPLFLDLTDTETEPD